MMSVPWIANVDSDPDACTYWEHDILFEVKDNMMASKVIIAKDYEVVRRRLTDVLSRVQKRWEEIEI